MFESFSMEERMLTKTGGLNDSTIMDCKTQLNTGVVKKTHKAEIYCYTLLITELKRVQRLNDVLHFVCALWENYANFNISGRSYCELILTN